MILFQTLKEISVTGKVKQREYLKYHIWKKCSCPFKFARQEEGCEQLITNKLDMFDPGHTMD